MHSKPQTFQGTSTKPIEQAAPPPPEIIRGMATSMQAMLEGMGATGDTTTPVYVVEATAGLIGALNKWADEIEHPPAPELKVVAAAPPGPVLDPPLPAPVKGTEPVHGG